MPSRLFSLVLLLGVLVTVQPGIGGVVALSIAALCLALLAGRRGTGAAGFGVAADFHRRGEQHPIYLRQCDPDAAGRPRPRAPGRS